MAGSTRPASPEITALVAEIRRLRQRNVSVREIARRTDLSKSFVHDITAGKRSISPTRAASAVERLSREQSALAIIGGQPLAIDPVNKRERSKVGRYMRAIQDTRRAGDFREIRRRFRRTVIRTSEGEFRFETDPEILQQLDDAGLLNIDEVFHYEPSQ